MGCLHLHSRGKHQVANGSTEVAASSRGPPAASSSARHPAALVDDEHAVASGQHVLDRVSEVIAPRSVDKATAIVNTQFRGSRQQSGPFSPVPETTAVTSGPSRRDLELAARPSCAHYDERAFQRITSVQRPAGLEWTASRKALELAIDIEQAREAHIGHPAASESRRLIERLHQLGLDMLQMEADGNCQFRTLSHGLYGSQEYHAHVREAACAHLERHRDQFEAFLGEDFSGYVSAMRLSGTWGDELTLRAATDAYGVVLNLVTSSEENWFKRYQPEKLKLKKELFATYISPVHYNAIRRQHTSLPRAQSNVLPAPV